MARTYRQPWIAGTFIQQPGYTASSLCGLNVSSNMTGRAFIQPSGSPVNSITGLDVASNATIRRLTGSAEWRGIATISSGTTIASVSAAAATSGAAIVTNPIQFTLDQSSASFCMITMARSVRAGAFEIVTAGSVAPPDNMPVAWHIVR